jgi:hypothetical protein
VDTTINIEISRGSTLTLAIYHGRSGRAVVKSVLCSNPPSPKPGRRGRGMRGISPIPPVSIFLKTIEFLWLKTSISIVIDNIGIS